MPSCHTCHKAFAVRQDGRLRAHKDPAGNNCPGSGSRPRIAPAAPGADHAATPLVGDAPINAPAIQTPAPNFFRSSKGKLLKRIPRGARDAAADQLARTLDSVLNTPEDRGAWAALFAFPACCLGQPAERGGKNRNLTTAVVNQVQRFREVGVTALEDQEAPITTGRRLKRAPLSPDAAAAKRAAAKLDEGDIKGAIRQLCSSDVVAEPSPATRQLLLPKHPPAPADRRAPAPDDLTAPLLASVDQVRGAIKSFPSGSSGGPDGLRPQHLKDMTEKQVGGSLLASLTNFVNLILAGKVPVWVRPHLFGASLLAFAKKDGG